MAFIAGQSYALSALQMPHTFIKKLAGAATLLLFLSSWVKTYTMFRLLPITEASAK